MHVCCWLLIYPPRFLLISENSQRSWCPDCLRILTSANHPRVQLEHILTGRISFGKLERIKSFPSPLRVYHQCHISLILLSFSFCQGGHSPAVEHINNCILRISRSAGFLSASFSAHSGWNHALSFTQIHPAPNHEIECLFCEWLTPLKVKTHSENCWHSGAESASIYSSHQSTKQVF